MYVIDVSQSVETDHPSALDFLRKDVANVNDYFRKTGGLSVMTTRQLFEFITSAVIEDTEECESAALDEIMAVVEKGADRLAKLNGQDLKRCLQKETVDEAVFMSQFLPRSLNQIADVDIEKMDRGEVEETYAEAVAALTGNRDVVDAVVKKQREIAKEKNVAFVGDDEKADGSISDEDDMSFDNESVISQESDDSGISDGEEDEDDHYIKKAMTPEEREAAKVAKKAAMKAHKKAVKESNSVKRKTKIKKKHKKRAINKAKGNKRK